VKTTNIESQTQTFEVLEKKLGSECKFSFQEIEDQ
jgi:hypothetical protein